MNFSTVPSLTPAVDYLYQSWRIIAHHQGDADAFYTWWAESSTQGQTQPLLAAMAIAAPRLIKAQPHLAAQKEAALVIATFGNLMQQCPLGNRALNLELALVAYQQALVALPVDTHPLERAMTLSNLATVYRQRIWGHRAENLEWAIQTYQEALWGQNVDQFPAWVTAMTGLAAAYCDRVMGDRSSNLRTAILTYRQALCGVSRHTLPRAWRMITNQLAATDCDLQRVKGQDSAQDTIEYAIRTYQHALSNPCL